MTVAGISASQGADAASGFGAVVSAQNKAKLNDQQRAAISELSAADRRVRAHEMAHLTAAGQYAIGGPTYSYTIGPDGQMYATGGDVQMDAAPDPSDPQKTLEKARAIEAAANAPANPSEQDRRVAARAAEMAQQAEQQLQEQERTKASSPYDMPDLVATGQILSAIL